MSEADRQRWNARWAERAAANEPEQAPVARLVQMAERLRPHPNGARLARALDLACGVGQHTLFLAELGYDVDAWDVSEVALSQLGERARGAGLAERIHSRQVDLDDVALPVATYDLVLDAYFLDRRLLPAIAGAIKPGGWLFLETLLSTPQHRGRPDFYLQPGELRAAFPTLQEHFYEENEAERWACLVAQRTAW